MDRKNLPEFHTLKNRLPRKVFLGTFNLQAGPTRKTMAKTAKLKDVPSTKGDHVI
jgi:hypothetical protein